MPSTVKVDAGVETSNTRMPHDDNIEYASTEAIGSSLEFMLKSLKKSLRLALPHCHPRHEIKEIGATVPPSQSCSFNKYVLNLPKLWKELSKFFEAKLCFTTAYYPVSNGIIERVHRTLKVASRCQSNPTTWYCSL